MSVGVAQGRDDATPGEQGDGVEPVVELGREGHHAHGAVAGIQQSLHLGEVGRPQQGRVVGAAVRSAEPRPFEVDADQLARADQRGQAPDQGDEAFLGVGDEARDERGRAVGAVRRDDRGRLGGVARGEGPTPTTVAVLVDEAGDEGSAQVPVTRSPLVSTQPGSTSPAGRATRSAVRITGSQPFFAGSWSLMSITSDSSPSFSRPGVCRFHLRMTHRNRK